MVTAEVPLMLKIRVASPPDTVRALAPGPLMVRSFVNEISVASVIVPVTSNTIVSPEAAAVIWSRRLPAPASAVVVTCSVVATPAAGNPVPTHAAVMASAALPAVSAAPAARALPDLAASRRSARLRGGT